MKVQNMVNGTHSVAAEKLTQTLTDKTVKTLASSIFKHLRNEGCQPNDIISVSSHLLSLVTTEISKQPGKADQ